jgi:hypothetical protein
MARKLQQKLQRVSVYIRIRLADGSQPCCPAIWESKKRLRPHWCLVHGTPEHHPGGVYHVRYRVNGKPVWEKVCVGDDPYAAADLAALRQSQFAEPHDTASQRIVDEHKPERFSVPRAIAAFTAQFEEHTAPNTQRNYKFVLKQLRTFSEGQGLCRHRPVDAPRRARVSCVMGRAAQHRRQKHERRQSLL